jgi:diguanylate cyclase (GGDEF)-like protein
MSGALFIRRSYGTLLSRLVWPTAILFAATLGGVVATIFWTSDSANEAAIERQRVQLTGAIQHKLDDVKTRLAHLAASAAVSDLLKTNTSPELLFWLFGQRASQYFEFSGAFLIAPEISDTFLAKQDSYRQVRPFVEDIVASARESLAEIHKRGDGAATGDLERELMIARLVSDGQNTYALAALPFLARAAGQQGEANSAIAVAYKHFTAADLKTIADLHAVKALTLSPDAPAQYRAITSPLFDERGRISAYLSWDPERPGDLIHERLVPVTLFGSALASVLFTFVIIYIRWIAKNLAQSENRAQALYGHDPLSGLPNRLLFGERLDQELNRLSRSGGGLAVMFLDLDRFKDVNDTYGHQAGDELIKAAAKRLQGLLRSSDILARFGGDEFAVIQTGLRTRLDAEALARRILDAVTEPFEIAETQVSVGVSIGIALAPDHGTDRETLMRLADTALYEAKSEGRNRYSFFQKQMDETIRMRKVVEDELRDAIAHDGLALLYQPLFSADGETIVGLEALVRWPHPKHGMISPANFISLAEERGLVIPLGEWVLRRACRDAKRWPGLRMAINVSAIQFRHRDFVPCVMRTLKETGLEPSRLELELTEGVVVEDADVAEAAMMELRALGVNLALDDFGTGYSSLIYLRRFAFDKIKIDRSFLESMEATGESAILVHSIVHLGRALGLTVTAEGVETREQHRFLQALGCHQLQGYLFSKPVPAEEIDRMLGLQQARDLDASAA